MFIGCVEETANQMSGRKDRRWRAQTFDRKSAERIEEANDAESDENAASQAERRQP
jgi:hypothetical protein